MAHRQLRADGQASQGAHCDQGFHPCSVLERRPLRSGHTLCPRVLAKVLGNHRAGHRGFRTFDLQEAAHQDRGVVTLQ